MPQCKKILFIVISVLLVVSLLCTFTFKADKDKQVVGQWDAEQLLAEAQNIGYAVEYDEKSQTYVYRSLLSISHLLLPYTGEEYNTVVLTLAEEAKIDDDANIPRLYYCLEPDGKLMDGYFCEPNYLNDEHGFLFRTYFPDEKNCIAINIDGEIAIESVAVYNVDASAVSLNFNVVAFAVFAFVLLLALIFERKLGYFSWIASAIKNELGVIKALRQNSPLSFFIHLGALLSTAALFILVAALTMFNRFGKTVIITVFIVGTIAIALQIADKIRSGKAASAAKMFLLIAVIIGVMMCYTSPVSTHSAWDDEIHLGHAYYAANPFENEQTLAQYKMFSHNYRLNDFMSDPSYFVRTVTAETQIPLEFDFDSSHPYTHISYAPMIAICALMSLLGVDLVKTMVLCRLANLLAYSLIVYLGIRKLKSGALIFSAVCLMPALLYLGCSFSYDFWLTAWLTYAFAYIISELQQPDKPFKTSDLVKILLAFFVGCSAKAIYCVMLLPLLFLSKKKFASPKHAKRFKLFTVLTIIIIAAILILPGLFVYNMYSDPRGGGNVDTMGQILYILTHPLHFIKVLFNHLGEYCSLTRFTTYSSAFGYLGGYDGNTQPFFGTFAAVLIVFCIITDRRDDDNYEGMQAMRWITLGTVLAQIAIISASMYIAFNNVGSNVINGCQFRYVFPMLAAFAFFLRPKKILHAVSDKFKYSFIYGGLAFNLIFGYFIVYVYKIITL